MEKIQVAPLPPITWFPMRKMKETTKRVFNLSEAEIATWMEN